jgi:hypothetical protein
MKKHWSEKLFCGLCGKSFRSMSAEAVHRHNAPILCVKTKIVKRLQQKQIAVSYPR